MHYSKSNGFVAAIALAASLMMGSTDMRADNVTIQSPANFQVLAVSPNGKWACGVFIDAGSNTYPFRWNLESGSIEMLGTESGTAWDVANDGTVSGDYPNTEALANHAPIMLPCYWRGQTRHALQMPGGTVSDGIGAGISPDGKYMTGAVCCDGIYTSYIWNEGTISRSLATGNHNVASCVSPDGQQAAGYNTVSNRTVCLWTADGKIVYFEDSPINNKGPWSYARNFSPDGTKLVYWGGWEVDEASNSLYLYAVCDLNTGERKKVKAPTMDSDLEFFDISNSGLAVGYTNGRGYVDANGNGMYIDDYLTSRGVDLAAVADGMYSGEDYYVGQLPVYNVVSVNEDDKVFAVLYYNSEGESCSAILKLDQDFSTVRPAEVKAEQLDGLHTVSLSWKRPVGANNIRGYNVYRDGKKLNMLPLNQLYYYDAKLANGSYNYEVAAITTNGVETKAEAVQVDVAEREAAAPYSLFARQKGANSAWVSWKVPMSDMAHKRYFDIDATDFTGFAVYAPIDMEVAVRYSKAEVAAYAGHKLAEVSFWPMPGHEAWRLNVYTRAADNSLQLLYTQPVTQELDYGTLNTVRLDTPLDLPSGDLIVAVGVTANADAEQVVGAQNGPVVPGYSDLLRQSSDSDFFSAYESSLASGMSLTHLSWVIDLGFEADGSNVAALEKYNIYLDGQLAGSTGKAAYETAALADGSHTIGVEAQYADGRKSVIVSQPLSITACYPAVDDVEVAVSPADRSEITATWQAPLDNDRTGIAYSTAETHSRGMHGNESSAYAFMIASDYLPAKLRGYDGYRISAFRFYPMSDAIFTFLLYENGNLVCEYEVEDELNFNQWNTCRLPNDIYINENAEYRLVIDCFDPEPETDVLALDGDMPIEYVSDLVSVDNGETWSSLTLESATQGNWMMGMVLEAPQPKAMAVEGYDVSIDGTVANDGKLQATTFTHKMQKSGSHSLRVDAYYPGVAKPANGEVTYFTIDLTGIRGIAAGADIKVARGADCLKVEGACVQTLALYAANGTLAAKAVGNRLYVNTLAPGIYVLKVNTADGPLSLSIAL